MKKFNWIFFLAAISLSWFLIFATFFSAAAEDEGTLGKSIVLSMIAKLFYVFSFPVLTFIKDFRPTITGYCVALWMNGLIYGVFAERLYYFWENRKRPLTPKNVK